MKPKSRGAKSSKAVLAATVVAAPVLAVSPAAAQRRAVPTRTMKPASASLRPVMLKHAASVLVVGEVNGHTVFKDTSGALFYVDPKTGGEHIVARAAAFKHTAIKNGAYPIEHGTVPVTIVGVDAAGHAVMQNAKGEKFYLDAKTGDMVFIG